MNEATSSLTRAESQRHLYAAIGALYSGLVEAGYLSVQLVGSVKPHLTLPRSKIDVRRAFSDAHWAWVMATLAEPPDTRTPAGCAWCSCSV